MRRLPNRSNNYNGHGSTIALPVGMTVQNFLEDPKTVRRFHFASRQSLLISEAQAAFETCNSWLAVGMTNREALTRLLDEGATFATLQATYERAIPDTIN